MTEDAMETTTKLPRVMLLEKPRVAYTSLRSGHEGQVTGYDFQKHLVHVDWDNGSRVSVPVKIIREV
jgi:hypothetical protein